MDQVVKKAYQVLKSFHPDMLPLYPGDTAYILLLEYPRNPRFIVEVEVLEVQMVFYKPDLKVPDLKVSQRPASLWFNLRESGYELIGPKFPPEKDEQGWLKTDRLDPKLILDDDIIMGNWFVWVDLPIGHALDPYFEISPVLDDLWPAVTPFRGRSRHVKSALHKLIRLGKTSIALTHKKPVSQMNFPAYRRWPERKVYWRRK